jgi:hypothetical protein
MYLEIITIFSLGPMWICYPLAYSSLKAVSCEDLHALLSHWRGLLVGLKGYKQEDLDGNGICEEIWNTIQLQGLGQKGLWGHCGG